MDNRNLIAYGVLLLIALFLGAVVVRSSREWRGDRRASRHFLRRQRERRAEQVDEKN
jgi:hypothetical protein